MVWFYNKEQDILSKVVDSSGAKTYDVSSNSYVEIGNADIGVTISEVSARRILMRKNIDRGIKEFFSSQANLRGMIETFENKLVVSDGDGYREIYAFGKPDRVQFGISTTKTHFKGECLFHEVNMAEFRSRLFCLANRIPQDGDYSNLSYYPEWWSSEVAKNFIDMRFFIDGKSNALYLSDASGFWFYFFPENTDKDVWKLPSKSGRIYLGSIRPFGADCFVKMPVESETREISYLDAERQAYEIWNTAHEYPDDDYDDDNDSEDLSYENDDDNRDELGPECNWPDHD